MVIELRGVGFVNKGAELILHSIIKEVRERYPKAKFVMESPGVNPKKLAKLGIYTKSNITRKGIKLTTILNLIPKKTRNFFGFVAESEIDVVLDGSGFTFGDKWGAKKAGTRAENHIRRWKTEGKKVIFLPQAFGPFTDKALKEKMKIILENADLIFARDQISYNFVKEITPNNPSILQFPDFTNLISGKTPPEMEGLKSKVAIIPNQKMMDTDNIVNNDQYPILIKRIINNLLARKEKPFFLIHEGKADLELAEKINLELDQPIEILYGFDALEIKGIIGSSKAVITSRFHGLVSALSQEVPCLATGWSHKYEMLLMDYNFSEALIKVSQNEDDLKNRLDLILMENSRQEIITNLREAGVRQKESSKIMWSYVFDKIK